MIRRCWFWHRWSSWTGGYGAVLIRHCRRCGHEQLDRLPKGRHW